MAWRPNDLITEGALAFNNDGSVKGTAIFNGLARPVKFDLTDCPHELRGTLLTFRSTDGRNEHHLSDDDVRPASEFMQGFALLQRGSVERIDIEPQHLTLAWDSEANQRICLEFGATYTHSRVTN